MIFSGVLSRKNCLKTHKGLFVKDLHVLKNIDLKDVALVDSRSFSYCLQRRNGVPILPWKGKADDCELQFLTEYLRALSESKDMRVGNENYFKLEELAKKKTLEICNY